MAFKSLPKLIGRIIIGVALLYIIFDCYNIVIFRSQQLWETPELNKIVIKSNKTVKEGPGYFNDADYLILTSPDMPLSAKKEEEFLQLRDYDNQTNLSLQLHKQFWTEYRNNYPDNVVSNRDDRKEISFLEKFKNVSLWATQDSRKNFLVTKSEGIKYELNGTDYFGYGPNYDGRTMAQYLWTQTPGIVVGNKTKSIMIIDSFQWWNYDGREYLSCPGSPFDGKCRMMERKRRFMQKPIDAFIYVRDSYHKSNYMVHKNASRIYYILESPVYSPGVSLLRSNDYLASYWRGSDIQTSYSKWAYYNPTIRKIKQTHNYAAGKSKMAAIFVSNCKSVNERLQYVYELSQYVQVDVYGACGTFKCEHEDQEICYKKLKTEYRFYLAFENSNCRDYITEKLFITALQNDVVPIVLGAHPDDYKAASPEGSFIHVEDFQSPKFLAAYMKFLAENDHHYNSYFEWKGTGEFIKSNFFCRVCAFLYYADENPREARDLKQKSKYYWLPHEQRENPMCLPWGRWYWSRDNLPIATTTMGATHPTEDSLETIGQEK